MKLCSQCEFIYEDDQEHCDMDGAQLVYEPTLEHVFPNNALPARTELERRGPTRLVIPLSRSPHPETPIAHSPVFARPRRLALQIAALAVLAAVSFVAFYATPRLFRTNPQISESPTETQKPKLQTSQPLPVVSKVAATSENSPIRNAKLETSLPADRFEIAESKPAGPIPALPGLKPLPRLKPLPTLKPIPRLSDRSRSLSSSRKTIVVNTSGNTKKVSGFGSFLKRTGRILTKPFKS